MVYYDNVVNSGDEEESVLTYTDRRRRNYEKADQRHSVSKEDRVSRIDETDKNKDLLMMSLKDYDEADKTKYENKVISNAQNAKKADKKVSIDTKDEEMFNNAILNVIQFHLEEESYI